MIARVSIILLLAVINFALFFKMIWGPTGIMEYRSLKNQQAELQEKISKLDAENMALSRDIRLMQSDPLYVEKLVRQKLHYVRDNELIYLFASPANTGLGAKTDDGKN